jgi:hypothetical protein
MTNVDGAVVAARELVRVDGERAAVVPHDVAKPLAADPKETVPAG